MDAIVKLTPEKLDQKNQAQLRQILRRDFKYVKGTSIMSKEELVNLVLELKDQILEEVDRTSNIDTTKVYLDLPGREWKVEKIEKGLVYLTNVDGFTINTMVASFPHAFQQTKYDEFKSQPTPQVDEDVTDNELELIPQGEEDVTEDPDPKDIAPVTEKKEKTAKQAADDSKSDLVRKIVRRQFRANEKLTSGTVMKELEDKHGLKIHRSFCSTILRAYKKTLEEADGKK